MDAENGSKSTGKTKSAGKPFQPNEARSIKPNRPKGPPKVPTTRSGVDGVRPKNTEKFVPPIPPKTTPEGKETTNTQKKVKTGTLQMPGLDPSSRPIPSVKKEAPEPVVAAPPLAKEEQRPAKEERLNKVQDTVNDSFSMVSSRKWQIGVAGVSLLLALSLYLNWHLWTTQSKFEEQLAKESPATLTASANKVEPLKSKDKKPEPESVDPGIDPNKKAAEKLAVETTDEKSAKNEPEPAMVEPAKEGTVSDSLTGTLSIVHRYPGFKSVKVSVNTRFRGWSPLKLELPPGKYDITFSRDGKRAFRRAVVESGKILEVKAKAPK